MSSVCRMSVEVMVVVRVIFVGVSYVVIMECILFIFVCCVNDIMLWMF